MRKNQIQQKQIQQHQKRQLRPQLNGKPSENAAEPVPPVVEVRKGM